MMKKLIFFSLFTAFFLACKTSNPKVEKKVIPPAEQATGAPFDQFIGTWLNTSFGNFEEWKTAGTDQYAVRSYGVNGADTVVQERVKVFKEAGNWVYEVTVIGQNNNQPVRFTSNAVSANQVNFSNPAHDFPTDINYAIEGNALKAFIAGPGKNGEQKTIPIAFERVAGG